MTAPFTSYGHNEEAVGSFNFRRRWANIDWRALSAIDVDRIAQTVDVQTLQQNILHVTFCNVTSEEFHNVDSNFIKLFRLSQLIIEYLLYTQQYLTEQLQVSQQQVSSLTQELEAAKSDFATNASTLKTVKKENRKRRKMIESYQQMLNAGATGLYPCHVCHREFVSAEFLKSHIDRRHRAPSPPKGPSQQENQLALNELETKLFDKVQQHLLQSQNEMKQEFLIKESELHQRKVKEFKAWKKQEQERLKEELVLHKTALTAQLQQQQQLNTDMLQKTLEQAQAELQALKESRSQPIDVSILPQSGQEEQYREMTQLRDELNAQLHETLKEERKAWKKKLKETIKKHEGELKESQNRLEVLEKSLLNERENHSTFRPITPVEAPAVMSPIVMLSQGSPVGVMAVPQQQSPQPLPLSPPPLSPPPSHPLLDSSEDEQDYSPAKRETGQGDENGVKTVLHNVLNESLTKRGVDIKTNGLSNEDFDEKMASLRQEQELRMKTHPTFAQQRIKIREQLKQQMQSQYKAPVIMRSPVLTRKPPPVPTPTKPAVIITPPQATPIGTPLKVAVNSSITTEEEDDDEISDLSDDTDDEEYIIPEPILKTTAPITVSTTTYTPIVLSTNTAGPAVPISSTALPTTTVPLPVNVPVIPTTTISTVPVSLPSTVHVSLSSTVPTFPTPVSIVPTPVSTVPTPVSTVPIPVSTIPTPVSTISIVPPPPMPVLPINRGATGGSSSDQPQDNFSDSSEDSIEKLISSSQMLAKASSTPIKSSSNMGLDPTKRPVGGVPVMMVPHPVDAMESDESDTFTISEVTSAPIMSLPKQNVMVTAESIPLMNKPEVPPPNHPTIISSHSGLTTVTPDDFDSDISDIIELK